MNHGVNSLGDFLQLGNAPVASEATHMTSTSSSERQDAPASPPPPIGEAAALVARLLAGSEPHVAVCEEVAPFPAPEPAPAAPDPIPTNYPLASLSPSDSGSAVLLSPNAKTPSPFSRTSLSLIIAAVTVLIFGSGLAVGYGVLGQRSKAGSKSTVQQANPPAVLNTAPSEPVQNQASALSAANSQPLNLTVNSPHLSSPAITPTRSVAPSDIGSDNDVQNTATRPPGNESEQIRTSAQVPHAPADSSPDDSLPSTNPNRSQPASSAPVAIPLSRRPSLESAAQSLLTSTQSAHPGSAPVDSAHTEHILAADPPDAGNMTALPTIISGTTTPVPASSPEVSNQPAASSMGHIDPCQLIHSVQPVYPSEAKRLHVEGDVQLRVVVSVDGIVTSVGLVSGPPLLVPAAIEAARGFRYKPAELNGKPIETVQTIAMSFDLKN